MQSETQYAQNVIEDFMPKAWRRLVTDDEIDRKLRSAARFGPNVTTLNKR